MRLLLLIVMPIDDAIVTISKGHVKMAARGATGVTIRSSAPLGRNQFDLQRHGLVLLRHETAL